MTEIEVSREYVLTNDEGGLMAVEVMELQRDGNVALLMPTDPVMRAWYRSGYTLGRAHWSKLRPVTGG